MCKYEGCDKLAYPHRAYLIDRDEVDAEGKPIHATKMVEGKDINWTAKHGFCGPVHYVPYMTEKSLWSNAEYAGQKLISKSADAMDRLGKASARAAKAANDFVEARKKAAEKSG